MYTLVVVDMQPGFRSAKGKRVRANCLREIRKAVEVNAHVIFLEFAGYEATFSDLTKELPPNAVFLEKSDDDGSIQVEKEVRLNKRPTTFKVCGINTDCCVAATVRGLTARFPMSKIDVLADACDSDWYHLNGLAEMKQLKGNVNVV